MSSVHTLTFRDEGVLACMAEPSVRLMLVAEVMRTVGANAPDAVLALPAGFVQAESEAQRDEWADGLLTISRDVGVGTVFGIDVADEEQWGVKGCPRSFAYACDRGRRLLWAAPPARTETAFAERLVTIGALPMVVLLGREIFQARALAAVESARADLAVVLGHAGPTKKWLPALAELDAVTPALLVHQALPIRNQVVAPPPRGWSRAVAKGPVRVVSYHREALAPTSPSWETDRP
jgi:hypothetical protein